MTDGDRLLAAVLASPDEDAPRLVFADWLDEHDDPARAEFCRVQCELAALACSAVGGDRARVREWCVSLKEEGVYDRCVCDECKLIETLRHRERELLTDRHVRAWFPGAWWQGGHVPATGKCPEFAVLHPSTGARYDVPPLLRGRFRRGFVESVTLAARDWLTHVDTLLAAHPVREVTLRFDTAEFYDDRGRGWLHCCGEGERKAVCQVRRGKLFLREYASDYGRFVTNTLEYPVTVYAGPSEFPSVEPLPPDPEFRRAVEEASAAIVRSLGIPAEFIDHRP